MPEVDEQTPASEAVIEDIRALDGQPLAKTANSFADFIRMVENGQFDADVQYELKEAAETMENLILDGAKKVKTTLTVQIEISREAGKQFYEIGAKFKVKTPEQPRQKSVAWLTDNNVFTPNQPQQKQMFGVREVIGGPRRVRN